MAEKIGESVGSSLEDLARPLSGVEREPITRGKIGKIHMFLDDKLFDVTGCITYIPDGVDVEMQYWIDNEFNSSRVSGEH